MKRFGTVALVMCAFIAGIVFVYACGGGGSSALAETTDVSGIESRLDTISNQITSLHNSITGADIMTIKVFDNPSFPGSSLIFSDAISVKGYREISFMRPNNQIVMWAHHTAGGFTQRIQLSANGTMPAYGDTLVIEAFNTSGSADSGFLVVKLVP